MRITAAMLTAVAVLLLPVTLFTVPHAREQAAPGSDADSSAFRFKEVNYSEHRVGAIRVMAPSIALPNWQRQTNLWRKATNSARG
jgi:hypothetical protein